MQNQIAKNTIYLYLRQLILLLVSLYTVRIVLEVLGVENYGIYNVIAGFVSMFNIVCTNLNITTQRYLSYSIGSQNDNEISRCFTNSFTLHLIFGILVVVLLETIGLLGFDYLNIPEDRHVAAMFVFQISVLTMFLSITQVPYNALVIANERMQVFAYISLVEGILKLALVFLLMHIKSDILIVYAVLMFAVQALVISTYRVYCVRELKTQSRLKRQSIDKGTMKEMIQFSGWSLLTSSSWVLKAQGVNMVLNIFFGAAINAARGVANQIISVVTSFMLNFQMAANPKINQYYAKGELDEMQALVFQSIKISFMLLLIAFVPIWIEINSILSIWLVDVPAYTTVFIHIIIVELIIDSATGPLATAVRASGKVKKYSIMDFSILIWNVPVCWIVFKLGYGPQYAYVVSLVITTIAVVARHLIVFSQLSYSWKLYWNCVLMRELIIFALAILVTAIVYPFLPEQAIAVQIFGIIGIALFLAIMCYLILLTKSERSGINRIISSKFNSVTY